MVLPLILIIQKSISKKSCAETSPTQLFQNLNYDNTSSAGTSKPRPSATRVPYSGSAL